MSVSTPPRNPGDEVRWYDRNPRQEMLPFLPAQVTRALEVGCASGVFGMAIKERFGAEVWGMEYNAETADLARRHLDHVVTGDATTQVETLPDDYFDFVCCNDVLEHLVDPWTFLRRLKPKLTPNATVVSSIPNIRYFHALETILRDRDFPTLPDGIFDRTHLRFFTHKSIERMFVDTGYRIERIVGINPTRKFRYRLRNALSFGAMADQRYLQFACVVHP